MTTSASPKTILLVSPYWKEEHRWMVSSVKLAELWQRLGYCVVVVCMGKKDAIEKASETLTIHTRKDFFIPDPWNYGIARGFSKYVLKVATELKPDVIIVNKILFWSSFALLTLRKHGFSVILTTDALVGMTWWPRGLLPRIGAYIYAHTFGMKILRAASRVVFFHPQPEKLLRKLDIADKSEVIPTGIDAARYHSDAKSNATPAVSYIGRLESVKGVDDFAAAASSIKRFMPDVTFQIIGWYKAGHPLVKKHQHDIIFTGLREDIASILSSTDIFVLPSYSEGLSNALMEAMASGCACVATNVGGNTFLLDKGSAGILFHPGNRGELIESLRHLLVDESMRKEFGINARKRIEKEFDWSVIGEKYRVLFESTVDE